MKDSFSDEILNELIPLMESFDASEEHASNIELVDLRSFEESAQNIELIQDKHKDDDIVPLFFTTTFINTPAGKIIRKVTGANYTHAAIGFDSDLESLYSFNITPDDIMGGLSLEGLKSYIKSFADAEMYVGMILLNHTEYEKVREYINDFIKNIRKTKYAFTNLVKILLNQESKETKFKMVCSQFVDSVLKIINLDLSGKPSSLTQPIDLKNSKNKRVYVVYEGYMRDYDKRRTNRIVAQLKNRIRKGYRKDLFHESGELIEESVNDQFSEIIKLNDRLNMMEYIIPNKGNIIREIKESDYWNKYIALRPDEFLKYGGGVCWDYVAFEAYYFNKKIRNIKYETFYLELDRGDSHTVLLFYIGSSVFWFESSWKVMRGIYKFRSTTDALSYILDNMENTSHEKIRSYMVTRYNALDKKLFGIRCGEYMDYMHNLPKYDFIRMRSVKPLEKILQNKELPEHRNNSSNSLYFYHLVPKKSDLSFGICTLEYFYRMGMVDEFHKHAAKYLDRMCDKHAWNIYPGRDPQSLTDEEIIEGLKKFRNDPNGANRLYLFLYPPYEKMGSKMRKILKEKELYRINLADEAVKKLLIDIDYGYENSNTDCRKLTINDYINVSPEEYFKNYTENNEKRLLFSYMNHISIAPRSGTIPLKYWEKIEIPTDMHDNLYTEDADDLFEEGYVINKEDIYYNKEKFNSGEINLCFITGHSGSGKSTMGSSLVNENTEHYELDDVVSNKIHFTMDNLKEYGDLIYSFFKGPGKKFYYTSEDVKAGKAKEIEGNYDEKLIQEFVKYAISYSKSHKNTKFVLNGIWLYMYIKPEMLKDFAVYIKGTSRLISDLRAASRDSKEDFPDDKLKRTKAWVGRAKNFFTKEAVTSERAITNYRKYFSKLMEEKEYTESGKSKKKRKCQFCGSEDTGLYIQGEPIWKCNACGRYLGTHGEKPVPVTESSIAGYEMLDNDEHIFVEDGEITIVNKNGIKAFTESTSTDYTEGGDIEMGWNKGLPNIKLIQDRFIEDPNNERYVILNMDHFFYNKHYLFDTDSNQLSRGDQMLQRFFISTYSGPEDLSTNDYADIKEAAAYLAGIVELGAANNPDKRYIINVTNLPESTVSIMLDECAKLVEWMDRMQEKNGPIQTNAYVEDVIEKADFDKLISFMEGTVGKTTILRDVVEKRINATLSDPVKERAYRKIINDYIERNIDKLTTAGPVYLIVFGTNDQQMYWDLFGINPQEVKDAMVKLTSQVSGSDFKLLRNNPYFVLFYYCIRYYTKKNDTKGLNSTLSIYALSVYWSIFTKFFPHGVKEPVMQYTIDSLTDKFLVKKSNHIFGTLIESISRSYNFHKPRILVGNDDDCVAWIQRIRNDQNSLIKKIANEYNKNDAAGNAVSTRNDDYDPDNPIIDDIENATTVVQTQVSKTALPIISNGVDVVFAEAAAKMAGISVSDCRAYLLKIMVPKKLGELEKLIESVLFIFIYNDHRTIRDIRSRYFLAWAASLFKKTNSKDPNIKRINDILELWAEESGIYERFKREASRINYKKAIFFYIILSIQKYS